MAKKDVFDSAKDKLKKIVLGSVLVFGLGTPNAVAAAKSVKDTKAKTELSTIKKSKQKTSFAPITLNEYKDIERLFDMSLNIIFAELILEEVPMPNAYDDRGLFKGRKNTIGTGSTYSPLKMRDYNNPDASWYHLAANPQSFSNRKVSNEDMLKLIIGWAKYRQFTQNPKTKKFEKHETVLQRMFNKLKGASLRPNEFSALFCAVYNNESNIRKLCPVIQKNYKQPVKCANAIMSWFKAVSSNGGTDDRCEFETAIYLNEDNICDAMMDMYTSPGARASAINAKGVKGKVLTKKNCKKWVSDAKEKYLKVIYHNGGKRTGDVCQSCAKYFINPLRGMSGVAKNSLQKQYNDAIELYNKKEYKRAFDRFISIEKQGADGGCDLLNDIAITAFNLNKNDVCISYCQKILKTTERQEYAKACYNAGRAYEQKGNYERAALNYRQAVTYFDKYGVSRSSVGVNYRKIYQDALIRVEKLKYLRNKTR